MKMKSLLVSGALSSMASVILSLQGVVQVQSAPNTSKASIMDEDTVAQAAMGQSHISMQKRIVALCWNLENYFDPFDDPLTDDEDFVFGGKYHWSWKKFERKRNSIAKTIISSASQYGDYPALIGFEEVENRMVVGQLIKETPLAKLDYDIIHRDSPDQRGIDVALIFRKSLFKPLGVRTINIPTDHPTRDILYVKGILEEDTIHVFVNHWPSKLGGDAALQRRKEVAAKLLEVTDSIGYESNILIMGDFNDVPENVSSLLLCQLQPSQDMTTEKKRSSDGRWSRTRDSSTQSPSVDTLRNLAANGGGTLKYRGVWEMIDQMIVSGPKMKEAQMEIYAPDFLLEEDKAYLGKKPKRTHIGPRYNGGVSDHLPIILLLQPSSGNVND